MLTSPRKMEAAVEPLIQPHTVVALDDELSTLAALKRKLTISEDIQLKPAQHRRRRNKIVELINARLQGVKAARRIKLSKRVRNVDLSFHLSVARRAPRD